MIGPLAQPSRYTLSQHDDREIGDGSWGRRHHRRIDDPEVIDPTYAAVLIHDRTRVAFRSHSSCAEGVAVRTDVFEYVEAEQVI